MRRLRPSRLAPAVLCLGLAAALLPGAVTAADNTAPETSPGDLAREGLDQMMRALRLLVESIPQYELPEVLDNGDIIIRRKHGGEKSAPEPEIDETAT